jgi:hypothetical protein
MPFFCSPFKIPLGNFIASKEGIGSGISSPSADILSLSLRRSSLNIGSDVMQRGGRQLVIKILGFQWNVFIIVTRMKYTLF